MEFDIDTDTWFIFTLLFLSALGLYVFGYIGLSYSARAKQRSRRGPREQRKQEAYSRIEKKYATLRINDLEQDNEKLQTDLRNELKTLLQVDKPDPIPFLSSFEKVYPGFAKKLLQNHPDLTPGEIRLCSFLRLNLSSKEIAQLLNVTPESVNKARYRLRKKLGLLQDEDLFAFLAKAE